MIVIEENKALFEVHYDATEYRPAGSYIQAWTRKKEEEPKLGFFVEVYVEGYRPHKDMWLHETHQFDTLEQAIVFMRGLHGKRYEVYTPGWYGVTFEHAKIYEYTSEGVFRWTSERG